MILGLQSFMGTNKKNGENYSFIQLNQYQTKFMPLMKTRLMKFILKLHDWIWLFQQKPPTTFRVVLNCSFAELIRVPDTEKLFCVTQKLY